MLGGGGGRRKQTLRMDRWDGGLEEIPQLVGSGSNLPIPGLRCQSRVQAFLMAIILFTLGQFFNGLLYDKSMHQFEVLMDISDANEMRSFEFIFDISDKSEVFNRAKFKTMRSVSLFSLICNHFQIKKRQMVLFSTQLF